jgi:hypothetical protein
MMPLIKKVVLVFCVVEMVLACAFYREIFAEANASAQKIANAIMPSPQSIEK